MHRTFSQPTREEMAEAIADYEERKRRRLEKEEEERRRKEEEEANYDTYVPLRARKRRAIEQAGGDASTYLKGAAAQFLCQHTHTHSSCVIFCIRMHVGICTHAFTGNICDEPGLGFRWVLF